MRWVEDESKRFKCGMNLDKDGKVFVCGKVKVCESWDASFGKDLPGFIVSYEGKVKMFTRDRDEARAYAKELLEGGE